MTQLFDLNARIQQLTWSLIFYEKYSTSLSTIVLVVFTTAHFGGFSNFCRYYTQSQTGKSTGYRPTLKPLHIYIQTTETSIIKGTEGNQKFRKCVLYEQLPFIERFKLLYALYIFIKWRKWNCPLDNGFLYTCALKAGLTVYIFTYLTTLSTIFQFYCNLV